MWSEVGGTADFGELACTNARVGEVEAEVGELIDSGLLIVSLSVAHGMVICSKKRRPIFLTFLDNAERREDPPYTSFRNM